MLVLLWVFCLVGFLFYFILTRQTVNLNSVGKYLNHQTQVINIFSNKVTVNISYAVEDCYCKRLEKSPCNSSS